MRGGPWNETIVRNALGKDPLPLRPVLSPVLTVDGRIEPDATEWLAYVFARTGGTKTAITYADSLCVLAGFLLERNCSLRGATRQHIVEFIKYRTVDDATRVSGTTFIRDRSTAKQFYEWLRVTHGVELPFTLDLIQTPRGLKSSMREGRGVAHSSAAGTPLEPALIPELLAAAWRIGPDGRAGSRNRTGARDAAFISLGLACGARTETLSLLTIYELPDLRLPGDLVEMRLPAAISKGRREVRLPVFRQHMQPVADYANILGGPRRMLLKGWSPSNPIRVMEGPTPTFRGIVDSNGVRRSFNDMTADERRRLVTTDGEPAALFLAAGKGSPLEYKTAEEITGNVSRIAEANASANGKFFPHVHTHDLRHTYATHLAALFMLGIPSASGRDLHGRPHRIDIRSAVQMASMGLGHLNEATTTLYIQQVGLMILRYGVNDFLGRK